MRTSGIKIKKLALTAMFVSIGLLLPFITGNIPTIGKYLCPMHLPIFLCGMICGPLCGAMAGFITPILRRLLFYMPVLYPNAVGMAFELSAYAISSGIIFSLIKKKNMATVYLALLPSMLIGRAVWGVARLVMLGLSGPETAEFGLSYFFTEGFLKAIPSIIVRLILIPAIMQALISARLVPIERLENEDCQL